MSHDRILKNLKHTNRNNKSDIHYMVIFGDSLSDRGEAHARKLLGLISFAWLSGLSGYSPRGRFTNGFVWNDSLGAATAAHFLIRDMKRKNLTATDISDGIINQDKIYIQNRQNYSLKDFESIKYEAQNVIRHFCQGGLTAANWKEDFTLNISKKVTRYIVSTLSQQRKKFFDDDIKNGVTHDQKNKTLIIESTGGNDLITVNNITDKNIFKIIEKTISARIRNIKKISKSGYTKFVLFNLCDLSLTPRFQSSDLITQERAQEVTNQFNKRLLEEVEKLNNEKYVNDNLQKIKINIFDVNKVFLDIYSEVKKNDLNQYGFKRDKIKKSHIKSKNFKINMDSHTSPSSGNLFYDDVHPVMAIQEQFSKKFLDEVAKRYQFRKTDIRLELTPARDLYQYFVKKYQMYLKKAKKCGFFSFFTLFNKAPECLLDLELTDEEECKRELILIIKECSKANPSSPYKEYLSVLESMGWIKNSEVLGSLKTILYGGGQGMIVADNHFIEIPSHIPY